MKCNLCPVNCGTDRLIRQGYCGASDKVRIAKYYLHPFEEPIISGSNGSGTVFFCGCSLKCVFCQNYELSRNLRGKDITHVELARIFQELQEKGAHNINLVNPTHYALDIVKAFEIFKPSIPVVYNTHGYEELSALKIIDPYINVYLPDIKFFSPTLSKRYTGKENYFEKASMAIEFMANKPFVLGDDGLLKSGTLVRHLVLPQGVSDSKKILDWFSKTKEKAYINVMSQYTPFGKIDNFPELQRKLTKREYDNVIDYAISLGIENMYYQKLKSSSEEYIPKWDF
ncbi:MAG: radical SAM protein [Clostridia bacterium]|nr:radical SAM protein [Clostridia bacterium]